MVPRDLNYFTSRALHSHYQGANTVGVRSGSASAVQHVGMETPGVVGCTARTVLSRQDLNRGMHADELSSTLKRRRATKG